MKRVLIIMLCLTALIVAFFLGRGSVKSEPDSHVVYEINENFIPYIEEYMDVIGQKKENNNKKFIVVSIIRQKNGHNILTFRYDNYTDGIFLTTVYGKPLILESNFVRFLIKPNRKWVLDYLAMYSKKDYDIYQRRRDNVFNPISGDSDELEITADFFGNIISHRMHFVDPGEYADYILKQDSLKWKLRNEPTNDFYL